LRFTTPRELGLRVRDRRLELGWSQAELARRVGMTRQWVIAFEKGSAGAALGTVLRTLSELGLVLDVGEPGTRSPGNGTIMLTDKGISILGSTVVDSVVERARAPENEQRDRKTIRRIPLRRREQG
jgi:transcriptional regulator with XRE-family HTH domain